MKRRIRGAWLLAGAAALVFAASPATLAQEKQDKTSKKSHTGEFQRLGDGQFRMTIEGKQPHTHKVTDQTEVTIDGKPASLEDLKKGDRIEVTTGANNVALSVAATRAPRRQGVVLGVRLGPSPTTGVLIRDTHPQGPGAQAGLRTGDYILKIGEEKIASGEDFDRAMAQLKPGDRAQFTIWRNRQEQQITVPFTEERMAAFRPETTDRGQDAWLGVLLEEPDDEEGGVRIARIYPSGPAARVGLRTGDRLVQVAGKQVASVDEAVEQISMAKPGEQIELTVAREGEEHKFRPTLADRSAYFPQERRPQGDERAFREFDDAAIVPEHSMMLEQHRRFAEQHQRIERKLDKVLDELKALRKELGQTPGEGGERESRD